MATANRDDLYLLRDGTHADPAEVAKGKDGVLRHANGVAVALREDGEPLTVGENARVSGNMLAARGSEKPSGAERPSPPQRADQGDVRVRSESQPQAQAQPTETSAPAPTPAQ